MAIQRWDPVRDLLQLRERLDSLFEDVLARSGTARDVESGTRAGWRPDMDLYEEAGRYLLRVDLPGVTPSDVEVEIEGDALKVTGERPPERAVPRETYLRSERPFGRFAVSITLPPSVDRGRVDATHADGVLEVTLPKKKEGEGPSRVKVDVK